MAAIVEADQRAAMRAAVLEGTQLGVFSARDHDGHGADEGGAVVADVGQFIFQAEEIPDRTLEQALLLKREHVGVCVYPIGDTGEAWWPDAVGGGVHGRPFAIHGSGGQYSPLKDRRERAQWLPGC